MPDLPEVRLKARWVLPMAGPAIPHGVVEIVGDRITAIHERSEPDAIDLGSAAILPGLVNAHTHLEFSHLRSPLEPPRPFAAWIWSVIQERGGRTQPTQISIDQGRSECHSTGTMALGEIATEDRSLIESLGPLSGVVFREVLGLGEDRVAQQLAIARRHLAADTNDSSQRLVGLSPHAPYSVHPELLRGCVELACDAGAPLAMHVAETREELEFLESGTGPLAELFMSLGTWSPDQKKERLQISDVLRTLARAPRSQVVHGNYLGEEALRFLAGQPQMSLVYCPRTHHYFGHEPYPLREALQLGINVALGTDSRASNPDLDVWQEARFVANSFPDVPGEDVLRMVTTGAARALGIGDSAGVLTVGGAANLVVADCADAERDPYRSILSAPSKSLLGVLHSGTWFKRAGAGGGFS